MVFHSFDKQGATENSWQDNTQHNEQYIGLHIDLDDLPGDAVMFAGLPSRCFCLADWPPGAIHKDKYEHACPTGEAGPCPACVRTLSNQAACGPPG